MEHEQILVLTKWGCKWLKFAYDYVVNGDSATKFAKRIITELDTCRVEPEIFLEKHTYVSTHTVIDCDASAPDVAEKVVIDNRLTKTKVKKGKRSKFAAAVANLAYNKFGERPQTEANVLVTRKWIQKLLEEPRFKDLRTCDKNLAIDRALFLSFIPTKDFQMMKLSTTTTAWEKRNKAESVFGKVFRLARMGEVDPPSFLAN